MKIMGWRIRLTVIMAVAAMAAMTFSCEGKPENPPGKSLSLSWEDGTMKVGYSIRDASLTVVARVDWTLSVTEGADWITVDGGLTGGNRGATVVRFTFAENPGTTTRTARIRLVASGEESEPYDCVLTQTSMGVLSGVNEWIYDQLQGWYYWNDEVKAAAQPEAGLSYDEFLLELVENAYAKGAKDNTENPPTIDGYYSGGARYYYSHIARTATGTRAAPRGASESTAATFGFGITPFYLDDARTKWWLLVKWVRDDSPAAEEGLSRGVWITSIDGQSEFMTSAQMEQCWDKIMSTTAGDQLSFYDLDDKSYSMDAVEMTSSPILIHKTLTTPGGTKTAYLLYNQFERGDELSRGKYDFEEDLREVFGGFKTEGVTELVLDLRYNGGGYVNTCRILTSLAADVDGSQVFAKMRRNDDISRVWDESTYGPIENPEIARFLDESNSLKLDRIHVLTTVETASASEMVISSLRGVMGDDAVIQIGEVTNGKNVGMDLLETTIDGYDYEMWPITFKILNAKDFCDYAGGLTPDHLVDEFEELKPESGSLEPLGDPRELLLTAALEHIDTGEVTTDAATRTALTRADGSILRQHHRPGDPRRGGAKYIPSEAQTAER